MQPAFITELRCKHRNTTSSVICTELFQNFSTELFEIQSSRNKKEANTSCVHLCFDVRTMESTYRSVSIHSNHVFHFTFKFLKSSGFLDNVVLPRLILALQVLMNSLSYLYGLSENNALTNDNWSPFHTPLLYKCPRMMKKGCNNNFFSW